MKKIRLCIEFAEDERWIGGAIYIENLLSILSVLPDLERPEIQLSILSNPHTHTAQRLAYMSIVKKLTEGETFLTRLQNFMKKKFSPDKLYEDLWFPAFEKHPTGRNELYWIPDFQHFFLPHLFSKEELIIRNNRYATIASSNGLVLLSSYTALNTYRQRYPNALAKPRVWSFCSCLTRNSPDAYKDVKTRYNLPSKFIYIPNQFWKHKDHITAFKAVKILRDRGMNISLICTGFQEDYRNPAYFSSLVEYIEKHSLHEQIRLLGVIPRSDQVEVFRMAAAILQPSLFEGWSTVIEDAKALGRPIIASETDIHREQLIEAVDSVFFFHASDSDDLADCLSAIWPTLQSGPNIEQEHMAAEHVSARQIQLAYQFINIAREAIDIMRGE